MRSLLRHPLLAFVLGLCVAGAAFAGTEAWARLGATDATNTIYACVKKNGGVTLVGENERCKSNESRVSWNIVRAQGRQGRQGRHRCHRRNRPARLPGPEGRYRRDRSAGRNRPAGAAGGARPRRR